MTLKWTGAGMLVGVPARDLTDEEAKHYGRARLVASGLYVDDKQEKPRPAADKRAAGPQENKGEV